MNKLLFAGFSLLVLASCNSTQKGSSDPDAYIQSVSGKIKIEKLGFSLTHEHVMSRFGLDPAYIPEYDKDSLFTQVIPYLKEVKALGVNSIFDCTAAYFGRNVSYLKEISDSTGIEIITNTGYYASAKDRYVPDFAFESTSEEIAKIWISEFENGIDETGIKPGFIKLAFDKGASEIDLKLFTAGVLTHLSTGLTMAVHTGDNQEAVEKQLQLLDEYKVSPSAWVWVHANNMEDDSLLIETASKGAWISLDKIKEPVVDNYVSRILLFRDKDLLHKVLVSHDGNSYNRHREIRQYQVIMTHLIPALKESGLSEEEINQLFVINPQNAFKVGIRQKN